METDRDARGIARPPHFLTARSRQVRDVRRRSGSRLMAGHGLTVNGTPLLDTPCTVTTTNPVVAPAGTGTTMAVLLHLVGFAATPLNRTTLDPRFAPKLAPVTVTAVPTAPVAGERLVMLAPPTLTGNATLLLTTPLTVTATGPVVTPAGARTTMLVLLQLAGVADTPLKLTTL